RLRNIRGISGLLDSSRAGSSGPPGRRRSLRARVRLSRTTIPSPTNAARTSLPPSRRRLPAEVLMIGGMDTKWGRRLFNAVQANGSRPRPVGSTPQLAEASPAGARESSMRSPFATEMEEAGELAFLPHSRANRYLHSLEQYRLFYLESLRLKRPAAALVF